MVVSYKVKRKKPVVAGKCPVVMFYSETLLNSYSPKGGHSDPQRL